MVRKAWFHILTVILLLTSVYFFYDRQFFGAVLFLVIGILRLNRLDQFPAILRSVIQPGDVERKANVHLTVGIDLEKVLSHSVIETFHAKLKEKHSSTKDFGEWTKQLIENFKKKSNTEYPYHSVNFNLKNGLLFKNDKVYFLDTIYEEVHLPYDSTKEESVWGEDDIKQALTIRIVIVNGSLNLEVGRFSKELSPEVYQDGFLGKYQHYKRITSYPLLLTSFRYGLPSRYMNSIFQASQCYKDQFLIKKATDKSDDWRQFNKDLGVYEVLVADTDTTVGNDTDLKTYQKMILDFNTRARKWLIDEKFIDPTEKPEPDDYWRWEDGSASYHNNYLRVDLSDWNARLEKMKENIFPDYWEEQP